MIPALVLVMLIFALAQAWWMRRLRASREDWAVGAMAIPAVGILFYRAAESVIVMLSDPWCFIRLMPAVALYKGYSLYYPDGQGPLLGWSYGPLMPVLQSPLGTLSHPVAAVVAGGILNEGMLLLPLGLLFWRLLPKVPSRPASAIVLLCALHSLMLYCPPSAFWLRGIQVDTFALGLTALGIGTMLGAEPGGPVSPARIISSALFFAAAVFTKQNEVFALAAPLGFLWARDGSRSMLLMVLTLAVAGAVGVVLCVAFCGWEAMFLNMWVVPSGHPWWRSTVDAVAQIALELLGHLCGLVVLLTMLAWISRRHLPRPATRLEWVLSSPWVIPAAAALVMFPISVLGRLKIGGADNSNHSAYYLFAAVGMMSAGLLRFESFLPRGGVPAIALSVILVANGLLPVESQPLAERAAANRLNREYQFAKQHPGEVWFSSNPLVTLYTDGKLYHQGYGVYDRTLAKQPPTPRQLYEHLPDKLRWVSTPGYPFWAPGGLTPIPGPGGLEALSWYEFRSAAR